MNDTYLDATQSAAKAINKTNVFHQACNQIDKHQIRSRLPCVGTGDTVACVVVITMLRFFYDVALYIS